MSSAYVLGISGLYHDAAAAILRDGNVVAAVQEERFTRRKNEAAFPSRSIRYCLEAAEVPADGLVAVAYYEKPITSFLRVLKSFTAVGIRGMRMFPRAMEEALRRKLWVGYQIDRTLRDLGMEPPRQTLYAEHHMSHAAAAFYPSPFDQAAVLTFDGVGEWATTSIGSGNGRHVELLEEMRFPASIGLLYSAFTAAAGFAVNSGEYKLMGLAPFGAPVYRDRITRDLIDLHDDGSFDVDLDYFDYLAGARMTNRRFDRLFDGSPRDPGGPITRRECDLASSIQSVIEDVVLRVANHAHDLTGSDHAVLGGGVALNCVSNGRLLREGPFSNVWVQPAAGDAGSALGCALWAWHDVLAMDRDDPDGRDAMSGSCLGPLPFDGDVDVDVELTRLRRPHEHLTDDAAMARRVAALLASGAVVGVCRGRMEFGPRALGNRSILADPRPSSMHRRLNDSIKHRESFRPFAPVVTAEAAADCFDLTGPSPYMSFVASVRSAGIATACSDDGGSADPHEVVDISSRLAAVRSPIPAVTHVDGTARIQTVDRDSHPDLHQLLVEFEGLTGCPVLVNTSFNVRGEPIVATAEDAYRCFMHTDIDWLLIDDCLLAKIDQPPWEGPAPVVSVD